MKISIIFAVVFIASLFVGGYLHEKVHVSIYQDYGIKSKVYYFKYFPYFATEPEKNCPNDFCILSHAVNEFVGYNLNMIFFTIGIGLFCIISLIEYKIDLMERR